MVTTDSKDALLQLVRVGIGNASTIQLPIHIEWAEVEAFAEKQGMLGVVYDGIIRHVDSMNDPDFFPLTIKLRWMGKVMQGYEQRYAIYKKAVADLGVWYHAHGYRMMVLKGLACGLDWPKPEHRPYGDIDIYLYGKQKEADAQMFQEFKVVGQADAKAQGFKVDNSHHHHTVFEWEGFTVENHYDFLNVHHHKSNAEIEKTFKALAYDSSGFIHIDGEKVFLPLPNLNALFLLRHTMAHFAAEQITIRHLLDWAFFVKAHRLDVDWNWLERILDKFGMMPMYQIINAICVEDLGFDAILFTNAQCDSEMKERALLEILSPEFSSSLPKGMAHRIVYKYRRWKGNEWKHRLCYNDSMKSSLWTGVWNHLLKPSTI